ncbi:pyridoxal-phosphate dependent enzyme [Streptomyces sp. NPDC006339]|uniref:pyridoxal-phosphate dependent enzyme n=1 Tax=Streptomyces sp. NPDC006339 TaxID=3156755 RepID=UPI0033B04852
MLEIMTDYVCPRCGTRAPGTALTWCCPRCRGPWDLAVASAPVPLASLPSRVNSLWRYAEALPLATGIARVTGAAGAAARGGVTGTGGVPPVSLGEGRTPLVPLTDTVSAKLDFLMPTLSFKDRGAVMLAELARRLEPRTVIADSSGNAGTAVAAYCARAGLDCAVYVPEGTSPKKLEQIRAHGARTLVVPGDREATARAARAAADEPGVFYASHVYNPHFLHGTKTYVYEIWEDLGGRLPDTLVLPVGNGTLLLGAALAVEELYGHGLVDRRPALVAVQAEAVSPLAAAFHAGADDLVGGGGRAGANERAGANDPDGAAGRAGTDNRAGADNRARASNRAGAGDLSGADGLSAPAAAVARPTLAEGIAIPNPPRAAQILRAVRASGGTFLTVPEDSIRAAQLDLARRGLYVEPTAVACWAAVRATPPGPGTAVLPLCGAGAKTGLAAAADPSGE